MEIEAGQRNVWRLIQSQPASGARNMAVDEALMASVEETEIPILRLYSWKQPTFSIGCFQSADAIDLERCRHAGLDWVRRPTGGRAVLHQHEVTYAIAVPLTYPKLPRGVSASYRFLAEGIKRGLQLLGLDINMTQSPPAAERQASAICFDSPSWYELAVGERKLVGSAQARTHAVVLQHGSILLNLDMQLLVQTLNLNFQSAREELRSPDTLQQWLAQRMTCLQWEMPVPVSESLVRKSVVNGLEQTLSIHAEDSALTAGEVSLADSIELTRYQTEAWWKGGRRKSQSSTSM